MKDPIHQSIENVLSFLASKGLEIQISDRCSSDSWTYDGISIARYKNKNPVTPFALLHEICHWLVASSTQREFPEFGLMIGVVDPYAWGPLGGEFRDQEGLVHWDACKALENGILTLDEQVVQEYATQMLSCYLGTKFEVPIGSKKDEIGWIRTWDQYWNWKKLEEWSVPTSLAETNGNNEENSQKATALLNQTLEIIR